MCGISGFYNLSDQKLLKRMISTLKNRGPENTGMAISKFGGIANARLSIIDVEGGNQPIWNEEGDIAVVANCEIYNFQELRNILQQKNHRFTTNSDTEVIVHGYEEWGTDVASKIDGIFAVAILDLRKQQLFLIRDRLGIKPLYYYVNNGVLLFGSEAKAILSYDEVPRILNFEALQIQLHLSYINKDLSFFQGIKQLLPGTWMKVNTEGIQFGKYWDVANLTVSRELEIGYLDHLIDSAIQRQLISDRPVGIFLSGGLDSSLVAYYASKHSSEISAFTQSFGDFDESPHAAKVADYFDLEHHIVEHSPEMEINYSKELLEAMEHPMFGLSHQYLLSKYAKSQGKVVMLSGLGGDELFAGYVKHLRAYKYGINLPLTPINRLLANGLEKLGFQSLTRALRLTSSDPKLKMKGLHLAIPENEIQKIILDSHRKSVNWNEIFQFPQNGNEFFRMTEIEQIKDILEGKYLKIADRMSMAASLELRVPLLDTPLLEYSLQLPRKAKINNGVTKYGLRRLAHEKLPRSIIDRGTDAVSKGGYRFNPLEYWEKGFKDYIGSLLDYPITQEYGIFNFDWVSKRIDNVSSTPDVRILWDIASIHQLMDIFDLRLPSEI